MKLPWGYKPIHGYVPGTYPDIDAQLAKAAHYRVASRIMFSIAAITLIWTILLAMQL